MDRARLNIKFKLTTNCGSGQLLSLWLVSSYQSLQNNWRIITYTLVVGCSFNFYWWNRVTHAKKWNHNVCGELNQKDPYPSYVWGGSTILGRYLLSLQWLNWNFVVSINHMHVMWWLIAKFPIRLLIRCRLKTLPEWNNKCECWWINRPRYSVDNQEQNTTNRSNCTRHCIVCCNNDNCSHMCKILEVEVEKRASWKWIYRLKLSTSSLSWGNYRPERTIEHFS